MVAWLLPLLAGTTVAPAVLANTYNIAVVHDNWYQAKAGRFHDVVINTVLGEITAVNPSVRFFTRALHELPARDLYTLIVNTTRAWAGVVALGGCRAQRAVARVEAQLSTPVIFVAWSACQGVAHQGKNTVILSDIKFDNRFNCLTWVLSGWVRTFLMATAAPINNRHHLNVSLGGRHSFQAEDIMYRCAGKEEVGNMFRARNSIRGKTLTIVTIHRPPFVFLKVDASGQIVEKSGFAFEMLDQLKKKLGFRYKLVLPYDGNWGSRLPNGTWNGMVGMVARKEVDLGVAPFTIMLSRAQVIDFTFPYYVEPSSILMPAAGPTKKITAFLDPFHYEVWVAMLVTVLMLGPIMRLMARVQRLTFLYPHDLVKPARQISLLGYYWVLCASLFQQGVVYPMTSASRVVFGAWITAVIALSCAYTGVLISFLTVPRENNVINSLHELASQKRFKWTFRNGSAHQSLFLGDTADGIYKTIGTPFQEEGEELVRDNEEAIAKVLQGTHVYIKEKSFLDFVLAENYQQTGQCNLAIAGTEFFPAGIGWIHPPGDTLKVLFNKEIILMQQTGLFHKWKLKYWPRTNLCNSGGQRSNTKPLDLRDMAGPFMVLACGFLCGLLSLFSERSYRTVAWYLRLLMKGRNASPRLSMRDMFRDQIDLSIGRTLGLRAPRIKKAGHIPPASRATLRGRKVPILNFIPATPRHFSLQ